MIVIPMAGLSSRFTKAGYEKPKYMLPLAGKTVFWHSLMSFVRYFGSEKFLFVARNVQDTAYFLEKEIKELGIKDYEIVLLDKATSGQAETVEFGLKEANVSTDDSLTIFNIDSFRKDFSYPDTEWFSGCSGYLEVFRGEGDNWSYVEPMSASTGPIVKRTTEKEPVSDLCSNGLYYFASSGAFLKALDAERQNPSAKELYIAPLYNHIIKSGGEVFYHLIEDVSTIFCGVPAEYEALLDNF